jgi:hypothetical protein
LMLRLLLRIRSATSNPVYIYTERLLLWALIIYIILAHR